MIKILEKRFQPNFKSMKPRLNMGLLQYTEK